jgi:hypothetical protein
MDNLKKLTKFLLITFSSLLISYSAHTQEVISLTAGNLTETVEYIYETYGEQIQVSPNDLTTFLNALSPASLSAPCAAVLPQLDFSGPTDLSFSWSEVAFSAGYRIAPLNLSGGNTPASTITTALKYDANNLAPQLYLFAFQTFCTADGTQSSVNVIIVDISIVTQNIPEGNCDCESKTQLSYSGPTTDHSTFVPWNSNCDYTKYQVCVEGTYNGSPYISCHMVIHDNTGSSGNGQSTVYVLESCGENAVYGPGTFVGGDHYGISFSSSGIHTYLKPSAPNAELQLDKVTIKNCNCKFIDRPGERPRLRQRLAMTRTAPDDLSTELATQQKVGFYMNALPNPVEQTTRLSYGIEKASTAIIKLYDSSGRTIETVLPMSFLEAGEYTHDIDFSAYPTGIYHIIVQLDNQFEVQKIVKTK